MPTVAILGASSDPSKYGNKSVRAHVAAGYDEGNHFMVVEASLGGVTYRALDEKGGAVDSVETAAPPSATALRRPSETVTNE